MFFAITGVSFANDISPSTKPLFLSMTNNPSGNALVVVDPVSQSVSVLGTGGLGGASGNAGAVQSQGRLIVVPNFGSNDLSILVRRENETIFRSQTIPLGSNQAPVSTAFGANHLYVLTTTSVLSYPIYGNGVFARVGVVADGAVSETVRDGSAAQIAFAENQVIYTEKTGAVSVVNLSQGGAVIGNSIPVAIPLTNTPFGISTLGNLAIVDIAHSDTLLLVANGQVISAATGPTPIDSGHNAPCWNVTVGDHFVFSADSPAGSLVRFLFSDANIILDKVVATGFPGATDLAANREHTLGMLTAAGASFFKITEEGEAELLFSLDMPGLNGANWNQ